MHILRNVSVISYVFDEGDIVRIHPFESSWEYFSKEDGSKPFSSGLYSLSDNGTRAYIFLSTDSVLNAVINALRTEYGACEWVEPKRKPIRKIRKFKPQNTQQ